MEVSVETRVRELVAARDTAAAATEAIRGLGPLVLRYLRTVFRDEDEVADTFSVFAENLWKGLPTFRGESSLKTWAFRLAHHAAVNHGKEAWRRHGRRFETGEASQIALSVRTATAVRFERQRDALERLRDALTDDDRQLLALRLDQGLSWGDVAAVLSEADRPVQPATLMKRYERLKDKLSQLARDEGLVE